MSTRSWRRPRWTASTRSAPASPATRSAPAPRWSLTRPGNVERVFRGLNSDLLIRPIRRRLEDRVRAHVLIRTLVYYVTWHMQHKLAPVLFKDDDLAAAKAARPSPAAPAQRSPVALAKAATKATTGGGPVHSFATLLEDL